MLLACDCVVCIGICCVCLLFCVCLSCCCCDVFALTLLCSGVVCLCYGALVGVLSSMLFVVLV